MSDVELLKDRIARRECTIGVIGLGYVGLPLVLRFGEVGFRVIGFDIDDAKVTQLNAGASYIQHVPASRRRPCEGTPGGARPQVVSMTLRRRR